jgi:hypothetical protein
VLSRLRKRKKPLFILECMFLKVVYEGEKSKLLGVISYVLLQAGAS